jgi:SAM-dependent methyltransferase
VALQPPRVGDRTADGAAFTAVAEYYDRLMAHVPYDRWVDYVLQLVGRHGGEPRQVLDLACGTGRVGQEFERRGYQAAGVDLSEGMIRQAEAQRRSQGGEMAVCVMDARRLGLRPAFDLVVSLYDSLNYVLKPTELQFVFEGVRRGLRPAGLFIFDLNTTRALRTGLFTQSNRHSSQPLKYDWQSEWDPRRRLCTVRMWFRWEQNGEEHTFEEVHYQRAYELDEVRTLLGAAGLDCLDIYEAYSVRRPGRWSARAFFVARTEEALRP